MSRLPDLMEIAEAYTQIKDVGTIVEFNSQYRITSTKSMIEA